MGGHGQFSHAFIWSRVRDLWRFAQWIRERNSECASHFVPILGKVGAIRIYVLNVNLQNYAFSWFRVYKYKHTVINIYVCSCAI
jgi:hypothetical protein